MTPLVEIKPVDRESYESRLRDFLPEKIIDVHTHVWVGARPPLEDEGTVTWPARVAADNPIEDLIETYRLMLPGKQVTPLIFAIVPGPDDIDVLNEQVRAAAASANVPSLLFTDPAWDADETERKIRDGGHIGIKSYLALCPACLPRAEIRIFDFFPRHQLEVCDRNGWVVMLHVPRPGRLRDPVNLAQMLQIERDYPNIELIIAHVGRAYCDHDVGDAFDVLAESKKMCFDISANTNAWVFERLIEGVGPGRIVYGSDMPILRMRMRRVTEGDHYVNIVPKGLYGDVSGDKNMGEVDGDEAEKITFFLYEQLDAFRRAVEAQGLSASEVEDVFYNNAERMLARARGGR